MSNVPCQPVPNGYDRAGDAEPAPSKARCLTTLTLFVIFEKFNLIEPRKNIQEKFAGKYFDAVGIGVDFTARDLQQKAKEKGLPWDIAKGFNGSAPISDKYIPVAEFRNLKDINFSLSINGGVRQQGNTSLMIFSFEYIISYLSRFFTLRTGDLIFTGTPKGVGPVQTGDTLAAYIENEKLLEFEVK